MSRAILFAEVPCFYAAVERADDATLGDRPIIIGGNPRKRGRVQGASDEALAAGVMLDQPVREALIGILKRSSFLKVLGSYPAAPPLGVANKPEPTEDD